MEGDSRIYQLFASASIIRHPELLGDAVDVSYHEGVFNALSTELGLAGQALLMFNDDEFLRVVQYFFDYGEMPIDNNNT